jgi:hypothetical protein
VDGEDRRELHRGLTFVARGADKSTVALSHERLADAAEADRMRAYWRERIDALKEQLQR